MRMSRVDDIVCVGYEADEKKIYMIPTSFLLFLFYDVAVHSMGILHLFCHNNSGIFNDANEEEEKEVT